MENKQPMSKDKKEFISWIIWLAVGAMFIAAGGIMVSMQKGNITAWIVGGSLTIVCGVALVVLSILKLVKVNKKLKEEKAH